jgi:tetratricopeptide (TPR) repeat protein
MFPSSDEVPMSARTLLLALSTALAAPIGAALPAWVAPPASAATFGAAPTGPGGPLDGVGGATGFTLGALATAQAAVEAIAAAFRDQGDYAAALSHGDRVLEALPGSAAMRGMRALALAIAGGLDDARAVLDAAPDADDVWIDLARAMLMRREGALDAAAERAAAALLRAPDNAYAHNLVGSIAYERGATAAALERFAEAARLAPQAAPYAANLAALRAEAGDRAGADAALRPFLGEGAGCAVLKAAARNDLRFGLAAEARSKFEACLAADPTDAEARRSLFAILLDGNDAEAARALVEARPEAFERPDLARALAALEAGDGEAAETALGDAGVPTRLEHAFAAAMRGDAAEARRRAALSADPAARAAEAAFALAAGAPDAAARTDGDAPAATIARFFAAAGDPAAAAEAARAAEGAGDGFRFVGLDDAGIARALDGPGRDAFALGAAYLLWGFDRPAAAALAQATTTDPQHAVAAYMLGVARSKLGDRDGAAEAFAAALAAAPTHHGANVALAEHRLRRGDLQGAAPLLEAAIATTPDAGSLLRLGLVRETLGDLDGAAAAYERAAAAAPDNFIALNQLAWHFASREIRLDEAEELARRADALRPGNASILDTLGWIAFLKGDLAAARETLARADAAANGTMPEVRYRRARAELAAGEAETAIRLLEPLVAEGSRPLAIADEAAAALAEARRLADGG